MKVVVILCALFSSALTFAEPISFSGTFVFSDVEPVARISYDIIDLRWKDARDKIEELREQGAFCENRAPKTVLCTLRHEASSVTESSIEAIREEYQEADIIFGEVRGNGQLIRDGDSVKDWAIEQDVIVFSQETDNYIYRQIQNKVEKLVFRDIDLEFVVASPQLLEKRARKSVRESRWRWHEDLMKVTFSNGGSQK